MMSFSKMFMIGQIHLTAIMTLVAGMPQLVCACSPMERTARFPPAIQRAECHCCGTCASLPPSNSSPAIGNRSCCNPDTGSNNDPPTGNSPQARGKGCSKVEALSKTPGILSTKTLKPVKALHSSWTFSHATLALSLQTDSQRLAFRWTGHSPAPPGDLVTSLQRLLI
jgi:hypothetical protein